MEDNPNIDEYLKNTEFDITLKKRMVLVLADEPREDISEEDEFREVKRE